MNKNINGFDPLSIAFRQDDIESTNPGLIESVVKGNVSNILKSYTGFFDIFSEALQNAIDAAQKKSRVNTQYKPRIHIEINLKEKAIKVIDNGCGLKLDEFLYCFAPNVSFKKGEKLRGNKGVGATFLAYGYNYISIQTKGDDGPFAALLRNGRLWVEDATNRTPRPVYESIVFDEPLLDNEESGTSVEIRITGQGGEKPKDLGWHGANNATQWFDVLRIVSPMGGIYLSNSKFYPEFKVRVIDYSGSITERVEAQVDYYYPHEIPNIKYASLGEIRVKQNSIDGDSKTIASKMPDNLKNLDCLYEYWDFNSLLSEKRIEQSKLTEEHKILIQKHQVMVYGCHLTSVKTFDIFNQSLGLRKGTQFLRGGLQLATDYMVQGDLLIIPLKRFTGYQRNTHIVVHFTNGNPDLGRKTFQPELRELSEIISEIVAEIFISYRSLMKADTGAISHISPNKELHIWKKDQEKWRDSNPFNLSPISKNMTYISKPQEEQDVIALFHQLIGAGIVRGINFFGSKINETYDAIVEYSYLDDSLLFSDENLLGVRRDLELPWESEPKVLEYKFDLDALFRDFEKSVKFRNHIDLVVCWQYSMEYSYNMIVHSLLVDGASDSRYAYAATHKAVSPGTDDGFEIIILSELIDYILDKDTEIPKQRQKYQQFY